MTDSTPSTADPLLAGAASTAHDVPVLIVGAGPAGLTTALALARSGVRSVVLTRHSGQAHTPRAHITNQRTLEILADLGVEEEIAATAVDAREVPDTVFVLTLEGPEVHRRPSWGASLEDQSRYRAASRYFPANLPQHQLEPILAEAARDTGLVDLRYGHEFLSLDQDDHGVTATVLERRSGREYTITAAYLVGADGARSRVAEQCGLSVRGEQELGTTCYAWVDVDLTRYTAHRPAILYWSVDPVSTVTWTMVRRWDQWMAGWLIEPGTVPTEEEVLTRVRESIGNPHLEIGVRSISTWVVNHAAADRYSAGRVFCMGDAVHRHPPTNGLGSNTSIADGYNLAWKLQHVLHGIAAPALLETYTRERAPVGRQVVDRAFRSMGEIFSIEGAAGLDRSMPRADKWAAIRSLRDDTTDDAAKRRSSLCEANTLLANNFSALGIEVGYRYEVDIPDEAPAEPDRPRSTDVTYVPSTDPGEHLPHARMEGNRRLLSTVDLVGGGRFTLIIGRAGAQWVDGARAAEQRFGVQVTVRVIGTTDGYRDVYGDWERVRQIDDDGCLLVRPDGFIAWRARSDPRPEVLVRAIEVALGRS